MVGRTAMSPKLTSDGLGSGRVLRDLREAPSGMLEARGGAHSLQTHETNSITPNTHPSSTWRKRSVAKVAAFLALTSPVAACSGELPPEHPTAPGVELPVDPSDIPGAGGGASERVVIGNPECYSDEYHTLHEDIQRECREAFINLSIEEVEQLSPLDQARWALYYRYEVLGQQHNIRQQLGWLEKAHIKTSDLNSPDGARRIAENLLHQRAEYTAILAYHLAHEPGELSNGEIIQDPKSLAAMFGVGTTTESQPYRDALSLATHQKDRYLEAPGSREAHAAYDGIYARNQNISPPWYSVSGVELTYHPEDNSYTLEFQAHVRTMQEGHHFSGGDLTRFSATLSPWDNVLDVWPSIDDPNQELGGKPLSELEQSERQDLPYYGTMVLANLAPDVLVDDREHYFGYKTKTTQNN